MQMRTKALMIARRPAHDARTECAVPEAWLGELVGCPCGHGIGRHTLRGCEGNYRGPCRCAGTPIDVLGAAIRAAREECALEAAGQVMLPA
jgi:hypothetical protein